MSHKQVLLLAAPQHSTEAWMHCEESGATVLEAFTKLYSGQFLSQLVDDYGEERMRRRIAAESKTTTAATSKPRPASSSQTATPRPRT
eukprot:6474450-Amphidinium_carterae.1